VEGKFKKILLVGVQGSGKSTQAKLLAEYLKIPNVETGQIFRDLSQDGSNLAKKVIEIMRQGLLVDDETTASLIKRRLEQIDCQNGFVVNGYPRSLAQLKAYDPNFDLVIYLSVPDEVVTKRLLKRGREDDSLKAIQKRLADYHNLTEPILDYYKNKGILVEISGVGEVDSIQEKIKKVVNG
jgi:adenylate kinase